MPFAGLSEDVFDAYQRPKWASNVHNLARMRAKETMLALADAVQDGLGAELEGLARAASDEVPNILNQKKVDAQWVYWARDGASRAALASFLEKLKLDETALLNTLPQDKHVILGLVVRETELWAGLRVAPGATVDRKNLAAKLGKSWERARALELIGALPGGAQLGLDAAPLSTTAVTLESLERHASELEGSPQPFRVGYTLPRAEALELGADLVPHLREKLHCVAALFRFVAWTRDNDHIEAGKQLQAEKAERRRLASGYVPGDRVRITSGLFAGKVGVVQEVDTKALVKVTVGKLSVVVPGAELSPAS